MNLVKTSLLNGLAVAVRMLTLLGINKVLAIYVGPAGYAALGQFQNAVQMVTVFASGAVNTGVTKYTAEYHDNKEKQYDLWRTAGTISLLSSVVAGIAIALFNKRLASLFLTDENYGYVFIWFAATLILFVLNNFFLAILNGKKNIRLYVISNIASSLFAGVVTSVLTMHYGLGGALVALVVYQSLSFFVTIFVCRKLEWFKPLNFFGKIDRINTANLVKYTAMALTSAACTPVAHIIVRDYLGKEKGWDMAGHWEAMHRFSSAYLMFITATLAVYYLPRLSELKKPSEIRKEIILGYKIIVPVLLLAGIIIYVARDSIIKLLFDSDFLPMRDLFFIQIIGDIFKIGSWLLAYLMLGKAMTKEFISTEIVFSFMFVAMSWLLIPNLGAKGVVMAYAINYGLYWMAMVFISKKIWCGD